jgi:O-antigen/teichoic acid export membrane protein
MSNKYTKNTLITFVTNWILFALSLGASIIIARSLGPEGKGIYTIAFLLPTLLVTFVDIGIGPATVYHVGRKKYSPKEVFGADLVFTAVFSLISGLVGLALAFFGANLFPGVSRFYILVGLLIIPFKFFSGFITDILLATHKIKRYNAVGFIQNFSFLLGIVLVLIFAKLNITLVIILQVLAIFISCIFLFYWTWKVSGGIKLRLGKKIFTDFLAYGFLAYLINISWLLHLRIDSFLVNKFLLPAAVGVYSIAVGLAEKLWSVSQSAGNMLLPKVCSELDEGDHIKNFTPLVCRNILFLTANMAIILFFISPWVIKFLYTNQFSGAVMPLRFLLIGMISVAGSRILSSDLSGRKVLKPRVWIGMISVLINIGLNLLFIPKLGISGAALATSISYTIFFLMTMAIYAKVSENRIIDLLFIKKSDFKFYKVLANRVIGAIKKKK